MQTVVKRPLGIVFLLGLALWLGPGLAGVRAVDDMDEMSDLCAGDMQWMIGWCLDMVTADDVASLSTLAAVDGSASSAGAFESVDVPGAIGTRAFGINPQGDIVGSYTDTTGTHGYLLRNGLFTTIDYPGATTTEAWGINPGGTIIGRYTRAGVPGVRGFLLRRGNYTDISIGNHLITLPTKIGASGEVVGCFHETSPLADMYGYVQRGSDVTVFPLPTATAPTGSSAMHNGIIPGGGMAVGLTFPAPGQARGYVLTGDTLTFLDFPGSSFTQAWDVNPRDTIVGQYAIAGRTHGFFLDEDGYETIDVPGSTMTVARGINPQGDIVGVYNDATGTHGFVLRR
jgi:hypothetical protein